MSLQDEWPSFSNVFPYDGTKLLKLVQEGRSPFSGQWSVEQLIQEVEEHVGVTIVDIPLVSKGSNNFVGLLSIINTLSQLTSIQGLHLRSSDGRDIVAHLARGDVNMPDFDGFPIESQIPEVKFEAAAYRLL